ncbi:uncharacterized protein LOC131668049 [Phymastichus coffea]|uniref:uncharacterized protein LOC131668049 n=1 Tax=Phymastichus coffea TaxID=108790 RepID=UPI00273C7ACD|nr:uncharacterized protein LOC131668049 [Phymastichus coffea]
MIPRLELQAAVLGTRLATMLAKEFDIKIDQRVFWSDSTTVLHWIRTGPRTKQIFVGNRLGEINAVTRASEWRWVPTSLNIADDSTRQSSKAMRSDDRWLTGPAFLREPPTSWPASKEMSEIEKQEADKLEARKEFIGTQFIDNSNMWEVSVRLRVLGWNRIVRVAVQVRNVFNTQYIKTRNKKNKSIFSKQANIAEIETTVQKTIMTENFWYRIIQSAYLSSELEALKKGQDVAKGSKLIGLRPFIDDQGLIRARGRVMRIWNRQERTTSLGIEKFENQPVILDANHYATKLLIEAYHKRSFHANNETVINEIRQEFYIIGLRARLRWLSKRCIICRLRRAKPSNTPMADLPKCRVALEQKPFSQCGIDYFRPMFVKIGRRREKRWGVLFTCLTTRAVHLELTQTLSASSAIMALQRLAARRGFPRAIFSDNGTNFTKASKEPRDAIINIDTDRQRRFAETKRFTWKFNPPDAPHMGGAWERLVRSVKTALEHALNGESVSEEVLLTLLAEVEHMVNSRPLTHVSVDPCDEEALTPNHFLIGSSSGHLKLTQDEGQVLNPRRTFEIVQNRAKGFWRRWLREYLPTLLPRRKWHRSTPPLKVGDIVLVVDYQAPRSSWKTGKITEVHINGDDGIVRSAVIRIGKSFLTRPVHILIKIFGTESVKK